MNAISEPGRANRFVRSPRAPKFEACSSVDPNRFEHRRRLLRVGASMIGSISAIVVVGCATPIGRTSFHPTPIQSDSARVVVREVTRGARGGALILEVTNLSPMRLETITTSSASMLDDRGSPLQNLDAAGFERAVTEHGPNAMGFGDWSFSTPPVRLDPIASRVNLSQGGRAIVHVGFACPREARRITLDVGPIFHWRDAQGQGFVGNRSMPVVVPMPAVPDDDSFVRDVLSHVSIGVVISNAGPCF